MLFIVPDSVADCAVKAPKGVTLKGAELKVALPKYIPLLSALKIEFPEPIDIVPPLNAPVNVPDALFKEPAKEPLVAVIAPVIVALVAVKAPVEDTVKTPLLTFIALAITVPVVMIFPVEIMSATFNLATLRVPVVILVAFKFVTAMCLLLFQKRLYYFQQLNPRQYNY